jgi:copper chaperone CopZ
MNKIAITGILGMCALTAQGQYKQINMTVFGMDCPPCAFAIRLSMKNVRGVNGVDVDLNKGLVTIKLTAGSTAELRQFNEAVEKNGFAHQDADVLVEGVLSGSPKAPLLQVTGTNDRYALVPFAQGVDVTALLGKSVIIQGVLPQSPRGKIPVTLRYKTIAVSK